MALAAQRTTASLTATYLTLDAQAAGVRVEPQRLNLSEVTGAALRGVPPQEVYQRAGAAVYAALAAGKAFDIAVEAGAKRLGSLLTTDVQLARTRTAQQQGRGAFFTRVLTGRENCALCAIASTQRYYKGDLLPIHPGCDCGVQQHYGPDPGQIVDNERLEQVHDAVMREFGESDRGARRLPGNVHKTIEAMRENGTSRSRLADYTDLIVVSAHGEYGPTLRWRHHVFTGAAAIGN